MKNWEKEFDKKFTRKSLGLKDKGEFKRKWFLRDDIKAEEMVDFIR